MKDKKDELLQVMREIIIKSNQPNFLPDLKVTCPVVGLLIDLATFMQKGCEEKYKKDTVKKNIIKSWMKTKYSEDLVSIDSELTVFKGRNVAAATGVVVMDSAIAFPAASINSVAGAVAATGKDCDCYW